MKTFYVSVLSAFLMLSGCSSDGSSSDKTPPVITSSSAVDVPENTTAVVTLEATDDSTPVTFSISGTDAGLFTLDGAMLTFTAAPDYEAPGDFDENNDYDLIVTATDAASNSATQALTVTVTNEVDKPTIATFNTTITDGTAIGTTIGTITIGDQSDAAITAITLSDGATGGSADFNVSFDGNITVFKAPDYAIQSTYDLTAVATSIYGDSDPVPVRITVVPGINKVIASDPEADDNFGTAVAMSGNYVIVGAPLEDNGILDINASGAAYIYINDGNGSYSFVTKLNAGNAAAGDLFGTSVAIDGNYVVIGAPGRASSAGAAYVFKNDGAGNFNEETELNANNAAAGDNFGHAVGISGDYVVAGAGPKGGAKGSVYVFENVAGVFNQTQELTASDPNINDYFGAALAIDGNVIVVGALLEDPADVFDAGSAYVFENNGGTFSQIAKLNASDGETQDFFGYSVAINGDFVVVGAYGEDPAGVADAGSAYVFEYNGGSYTQVAKLNASDAQAGDRFGNAVGISADHIIVGAELEDPFSFTLNGAGGSAYIFENNAGFSQIAKLNAPDGKAGDYFGASVGISGFNAVVGAKIDDHSGAFFAGSAYLFRFVP